MTWLSPAFPIGSYCYSHGLEAAVEAGYVSNEADLYAWIANLLLYGTGKNEAILFNHSYTLTAKANWDELTKTIALLHALRPSQELWLESTHQGEAFLTAIKHVWPHPSLVELENGLQKVATKPPLVLVVAFITALHYIDKETALAIYLHAFCANLVSAGVRLIPLGQTMGQRVLKQLDAVVIDVMQKTAGLLIDDLSSATPMLDWLSMKHETQYTRIFCS